MDDESGESMELMEEVPLKELGESELERLVRGWRREAGSWFQRRGEAYWKERSVVGREDDVDGRASVTKDEERGLRTCRTASVCKSQTRTTLDTDTLMTCWSTSLMTMSTMLNAWPTMLPVGSPSKPGCQRRMILSTPPVTIMFVVGLKSNVLTPPLTDTALPGGLHNSQILCRPPA